MPAAAGSPADAKWMDAEGVSIPVPPAEHPRVYLRARDLGDLERRTKALGALWQELQTLGKSNPQIGAEVDALRYLLGHDAELGKRAAAAALATMEAARFDPKGQDVTRPIGRLMCTGAMVYDWCYRVLTAGAEAGLPGAVRAAGQSSSNPAIRRARSARSPGTARSG